MGLVVAASASSLPKHPSRHASIEKAIRALDAKWSKTAAGHDLDATLSFYRDDAVLLAPNEPLHTTKKTIRASWAPPCDPTSKVSWSVKMVKVAKAGDLAYSIGTHVLTVNDAHGKPVDDKGKFMEVWKKQRNGQWKVVADMF